jgi:HSP20 family molecular chaperone IbpA
MTRSLDLFSGSPHDFQIFIDQAFQDFPFHSFYDLVHADGYPLTNIYISEDKSAKIEMTVTGMSKDDITLEVEDDCLIIKGQIEKKEDKKWRLVEGKIKKTSFEKRYRLSNKLDYSKAIAEIENGLLIITIPPKESSMRKQISIK